jgi:hypothetical protein
VAAHNLALPRNNATVARIERSERRRIRLMAAWPNCEQHLVGFVLAGGVEHLDEAPYLLSADLGS